MKSKLAVLLFALFGLGLFAVQSAAAATFVSVRIINKTNDTVCTLNISPNSSNVWTNNVLGNGQMKPWAERTFSIEAGVYDIRAVDCAGKTLATSYDVPLNTNRSFELVSDTNPAPPSNGGSNGDCVIPPSGPWPPCATGGGNGGNPPPPSNGGNNGGDCVIPPSGPWPPCASGGGSSAPASKVSLEVFNNTPITFCQLHISPVNSSTWGGDWLGNGTLPAGARRTFQVAPGNYDLAVRNCSGDIVASLRNARIDGNLRWTISD